MLYNENFSYFFPFSFKKLNFYIKHLSFKFVCCLYVQKIFLKNNGNVKQIVI